jgi:hypothetical protein
MKEENPMSKASGTSSGRLALVAWMLGLVLACVLAFLAAGFAGAQARLRAARAEHHAVTRRLERLLTKDASPSAVDVEEICWRGYAWGE